MLKLIIKPQAEEDVKEAAKWYNTAREGLGNDFLLALEAKLNAISRNPEAFQLVYKKVRRALTDRFPYGIFFIVENNKVFVIAIIHTCRNPKVWRKRK